MSTMGKQAARILDPTVHPLPGILTPGPGAFNVVIGMRPAWRALPAAAAAGLQAAKQTSDAAIKTAEAATVAAAGTPGAPAALAAEQTAKATALSAMSSAISGAASAAGAASGGVVDTHMCATPLPIPPHGPGVVIDGSPTVLINGLPASRQGDTILEALGPPNKIAMGQHNVLIGGASSSGGGAAAGPGAAGAAGGGAAPGVASGAATTPQTFATAEEAAVHAMQNANPTSVNENLEYGGWVRENPDGTFSYDPPVRGTVDGLSNMPNKGPNDVVWYHTHGATDPRFDSENFSGATGDMGYSNANNAIGYVATPTGVIKRYDPATGAVTTLSETAPP